MNKEPNTPEPPRFVVKSRPTLHSRMRMESHPRTMGKEMLQIDPVAEMVRVRKFIVLEKAITALEGLEAVERSSSDYRTKLAALAHEMGGAIAFYTFESEARELSEFSHWLETEPGAPIEEIESKRVEILNLLREKREK